jgi:hypothetical protein
MLALLGFYSEEGMSKKLVGVRSLEKAIEIQIEYLQCAHKGFVAQATKTCELYTKLAQDSFAPFNARRSAVAATIVPAKAATRAK